MQEEEIEITVTDDQILLASPERQQVRRWQKPGAVRQEDQVDRNLKGMRKLESNIVSMDNKSVKCKERIISRFDHKMSSKTD